MLGEGKLKLLPIGNATFRDVIKGDYLYVDKTRYIYELVGHYKGIYFLSRPRRFGKSLMVSTLDEIFQGNRELFKGLWIDEQADYDWTPHPVIQLDFSQEMVRNATELEEVLNVYLDDVAQRYDIQLEDGPPNRRFRWLIQELAKQSQVVILIDEYDKPILDNIQNLEEADRVRRVLKGFYGVIKAMGDHIRFVFITGISNNLQGHIAAFAAKKRLTEDALLDNVRRWYDGFRFAPEAERVYNPFSTLLLFKTQRFANYWFETGTPTFLIEMIHQNNYDVESLHNLRVSEMAFSTYDIKQLELIPLLVQTGYLTIKDYDDETQIYTLSYPNYEVENAFLVYLLDAFSSIEQGLSESHLVRMIEALRGYEMDTFFNILKILFANIDYDLHVKNEKYYQTIFYLVFKLMGLRIDAEVKTSVGRIDAVVELVDRLYLFEFKLNKDATVALDQIDAKKYHEKYAAHGKIITRCKVAELQSCRITELVYSNWIIKNQRTVF